MKVYCPKCKEVVQWEDNPFRPFCSKRCRLIDLGQWSSEGYRLESSDAADQDALDVSQADDENTDDS